MLIVTEELLFHSYQLPLTEMHVLVRDGGHVLLNGVLWFCLLYVVLVLIVGFSVVCC